jgi:hypothetical protein
VTNYERKGLGFSESEKSPVEDALGSGGAICAGSAFDVKLINSINILINN